LDEENTQSIESKRGKLIAVDEHEDFEETAKDSKDLVSEISQSAKKKNLTANSLEVKKDTTKDKDLKENQVDLVSEMSKSARKKNLAVNCPICNKMIGVSYLEKHVDSCVTSDEPLTENEVMAFLGMFFEKEEIELKLADFRNCFALLRNMIGK